MPIVAGYPKVTVSGAVVVNGKTHPTPPVSAPVRPTPPPAPPAHKEN